MIIMVVAAMIVAAIVSIVLVFTAKSIILNSSN